jgi:hypothetical protein
VDLLIHLDGLNLVPEMMALVAADKPGLDVARMAADLKTILAVRLPTYEKGQGPKSGERLRQRRCQALRKR